MRLILAGLLACAGCMALADEEKAADSGEILPRVRLTTARGEIDLELYEDAAPNTVANFIELAEKRFFDGLTFHDVGARWVQSGDPTGTGLGSAGHKFKHEINADSLGLDKLSVKDFAAKHKQPAPAGAEAMTVKELFERQGYKYITGVKSFPVTKHVIAMANEQPDTNSSQFIITTADCQWLNGKHTVFGRVVAGSENLRKIKKGDRIDRVEVLVKREHPYRVTTTAEAR